MNYYLLVGASSAIASMGLMQLVKGPFFRLALSTLGLLDMMLDTTIDENHKTRELSIRLIRLLASLFLFLFFIAFVLLCAFLFLLAFYNFSINDLGAQDFRSFEFWLAVSLGGTIPFLLWPKRKETYSDWSQLFHKLMLDYKQVGKLLFRLDQSWFLPKEKPNDEFVIVSGLARSGTTALTRALFDSGHFSSLSYANMPMLMAPRLWSKIYSPKANKGTERRHGDKVINDYKSVEAFEEYFFQVMTHEEFIHSDHLVSHNVSDAIYRKYLNYQQLVTLSSKIYLAKNNNLMLRYKSLRQFNKKFVAVIMFREPLAHAQSLLHQHQNFVRQQDDDPFVLRYMNWLGHFEFGQGHKPFRFASHADQGTQDTDHIDYWLQSWIDYYGYLLNFVNDENLILVNYQDYLEKPNDTLTRLFGHLELPAPNPQSKFTKKTEEIKLDYDHTLAKKANQIYEDLVSKEKKG